MLKLKRALKYLLALLYVLGGANHFLNPAFYLKIMPPYLPQPLFLIYLSGLLEVALGLALLIPRHTRRAAWGLFALTLAVFPANLHMAFHTALFPAYSPLALWLRLPLQFLLLAWIYLYTRPAHTER